MTTAAIVLAALSAALGVGPMLNPLTRLEPVGVRWMDVASTSRSPRFRLVAGMAVSAVCGAWLVGTWGAVVVTVAAPLVMLAHARHQVRRRSRQRSAEVVEGCLVLASELAAGAPAHRALGVVGSEWPELFGAAWRQAVVGGDAVEALRDSARLPGAQALVAVAAAWEVSERTGARLSSVLAAVADSVRAEATVRREADTQLATVRTTSRLMAVLPFGTVALFSTGDGSAARFLVTTPVGLTCLGFAAALIVAGLLWIDRVSRLRSVWEP